MRTAPHLCRPIEFVFPGYRGETPEPAHAGHRHRALQRARALAPARARPQAVGRRALRAGAAPAHRGPRRRGRLRRLPDRRRAPRARERPRRRGVRRDRRQPPARRARCCAIAAGRVSGVRLVDVETGDTFEARARVVLSATGPFTDSFLADGAHRLRPTLGVHLVFDAARVPHGGRALVLRSPRDNRLFFVLPAGARTIVGTTDTDWTVGAAAAPRRRHPRARRRRRVPARGGEPRLPQPGGSRPTTCCRRSRRCGRCSRPAPTRPRRRRASTRSCAPPTACWSIAGGKLTTLRRMGEQAVDAAVEALHAAGLERALVPCVTAHRPLPGGGAPPASLAELGLAPDVAARLATAYGGRADEVLQLAGASPELAARIDPELPYLWAEVVYAVRARARARGGGRAAAPRAAVPRRARPGARRRRSASPTSSPTSSAGRRRVASAPSPPTKPRSSARAAGAPSSRRRPAHRIVITPSTARSRA